MEPHRCSKALSVNSCVYSVKDIIDSGLLVTPILCFINVMCKDHYSISLYLKHELL